LVSAEYSEELLVVNASRLVLPELVNELVEIILIYLQPQVLEYVSEVLFRDESSLLFVNQSESIKQTLYFAPLQSFTNQEYDLLLSSPAPNAVS
jgi:hypothetical protein